MVRLRPLSTLAKLLQYIFLFATSMRRLIIHGISKAFAIYREQSCQLLIHAFVPVAHDRLA